MSIAAFRAGVTTVAAADDMLAVLNAAGWIIAADELRQRVTPLDQRERAEVRPVQVQEVEGHEDEALRLLRHGALESSEVGAACSSWTIISLSRMAR